MEHLRPVAKAEAQATVTDAVRAWPQPCVVGWVVWHMVACLFVIPVVELRCWIKAARVSIGLGFDLRLRRRRKATRVGD
jgi:hypothetical protein